MLDRSVLLAIAALVAMIFSGALGFVLIEGYTWAEGVYMAVITVTTVGFGEIRPLSPAGRGFATVYTLLSFISVAVVLHSLVTSMLDGVLRPGREGARMKKTIAAMTSHFLICGYGRMGKAATWPFEVAGLDYVVVESDPVQCEELRKTKIPHVQGDATQVDTLREAGIERARGLLALLGSDPHNLYIVLTARELNPSLHIIARVENEGCESRIVKAGANSVVSPFATAGCRVGTSMIQSTVDRKEAPAAQPQAVRSAPGRRPQSGLTKQGVKLD